MGHTAYQFEIDEYRFLASFADSYPDPAISDRLADATQGKGAFRRFKDLVHRLGIESQWYEYRAQRMLEVAREWCEEEGIPYGEGPRRVTPGREAVPEALVVGSDTAYHPRSTLAHARKEET